MTKSQIETFLLSKKGYIKKSSIETAKAIWKASPKSQPRTHKDLQKELDLIKEVQSDLRRAKTLEEQQMSSKLLDIYQEIINYKNKPRRILYLDIEVSPNLVFTWGIGNKISINHDSIVHERAVICICYKWSDSNEVGSFKWDNGCDKQLLKQFAKVINSADIICGHNIKNFDLKWVVTRCLLHNIELNKKFNVVDTLTMARSNFRFNSNRLDYISKFLGETGKTDTSYKLWKDIVLKNDKKAMDTMVNYCKNDVMILEKVHKQIQKVLPEKKFKYSI